MHPTIISINSPLRLPRAIRIMVVVATNPAYTIKAKKLEGFTPSILATVMYNTWFSTNYVFYADGGDVVRYNTNNGDKTVLYSAPAGYTITCMKFRSEDNFPLFCRLGSLSHHRAE